MFAPPFGRECRSFLAAAPRMLLLSPEQLCTQLVVFGARLFRVCTAWSVNLYPRNRGPQQSVVSLREQCRQGASMTNESMTRAPTYAGRPPPPPPQDSQAQSLATSASCLSLSGTRPSARPQRVETRSPCDLQSSAPLDHTLGFTHEGNWCVRGEPPNYLMVELVSPFFVCVHDVLQLIGACT